MDYSGIALLVAAALGLMGVLGIISQSRHARQEKTHAQSAVQQAQQQPDKATPAWDLAHWTLREYLNKNLNQITWVFWLSVSVFAVGFIVLVWGLSVSLRPGESLKPAALVSAAGAFTEFLAATFLFVYRSTVRQALHYSIVLERMTSVGMAVRILDTMTDSADGDLKNQTKAIMAEMLLRTSQARQSGEGKPLAFDDGDERRDKQSSSRVP